MTPQTNGFISLSPGTGYMVITGNYTTGKIPVLAIPIMGCTVKIRSKNASGLLKGYSAKKKKGKLN